MLDIVTKRKMTKRSENDQKLCVVKREPRFISDLLGPEGDLLDPEREKERPIWFVAYLYVWGSRERHPQM